MLTIAEWGGLFQSTNPLPQACRADDGGLWEMMLMTTTTTMTMMLMTTMTTTMTMMSFETSPGADDGGLGGGGDDMRAADRVFLPPLPPGTTAKYKYRLTPSDKYICKHQRSRLDRIREI